MITSFKELRVWKDADQLAFDVFRLTDRFPSSYRYDLSSQLRRATLSVPTNIAEGCASRHTREFLQFLNIARRSLSETQYLLHFATRCELLNNAQYANLISSTEDISKMLNGLIKSLLRNEKQ